MRSIPFVDADGVVLWESTDEHEMRRLLRSGNYVPVWGARRIVALLYAPPDGDELMSRGGRGRCWSASYQRDKVWTLTEIPRDCEEFFSPRWKSIFRQPARPSVFLPDPNEQPTVRIQPLQGTSAPDWLLRSLAACSPNTGE